MVDLLNTYLSVMSNANSFPVCVCRFWSTFSVPFSSPLSFSCPQLSLALEQAQAGSAGRLRYYCSDTSFPKIDLIREYGASLDSQRFSAMPMNCSSPSVWDVLFWVPPDAAMGAQKKKLGLLRDRGASVCH